MPRRKRKPELGAGAQALEEEPAALPAGEPEFEVESDDVEVEFVPEVQLPEFEEEVEVEPQHIVELVDSAGVGDCIQAVIAQIDANRMTVALFDEGVVVAVIGS